MNSVNSFSLGQDKYLFFDIFYKNDYIYLIVPIYSVLVKCDDIKIQINNKRLSINKEYIKDSYEPICIYRYHHPSENEIIKVSVEYENIIRCYDLPSIKTTKTTELSLTTLFLDDYKLFKLFYKYYKKEGVTKFILYYNGKITDEVRSFFTEYMSDISTKIILVEWNFNYWNDKKTNKYRHHAQMGQLHHAIYKYGKDVHEYMVFCDFDEYLHIPSFTLKDYISENKEIDVFGFCNRWSRTLDGPKPIEFPRQFQTSDPISYGPKRRSKNIYKLDVIETTGIHAYNKFIDDKPINKKLDFWMFHFHNWSQQNRRITGFNQLYYI